MKTYNNPVTLVTDYQTSYMVMVDISGGEDGPSGIHYEQPFTPIDIN